MSLLTSGASYSPLVVFAGELGCALNGVFGSSYSTTGGQPTDDSATINAFLATATAVTPVKLIMDGVAYIANPIQIPTGGHVTIEGLGWDTGFTMQAGSGVTNSIQCGNIAPTNGGTPGAIVSSNIVLRNFAFNPNGQGYGGIWLEGCSHCLIEDVWCQGNALQFCCAVTNCTDISWRGYRADTSTNLHDGIHIDGPFSRGTIIGCTFATGDDAIALNAPEGWGGDITDVVVDGCIFQNSWTVARIYTSGGGNAGTYNVRRVVFANCTGTTTQECFNLGIGQGATSTVDQIKDLQIVNCSLRSPVCLIYTQGIPIGMLTLDNVIFNAPTAAVPMLNVDKAADIVLKNCTILRNGDGNAAAYFVSVVETIGRLTLAGLRVVNEVGSSYTAIPYIINNASGIGQVHITDVDMGGITALAGTFGSTVISGPGVLATGAEIPDANMANNAYYLNASGTLSVKINGTIKTF